ncbi:MAG TPA: polyprenyl diphosphate synthase [Caulobacteraceae bacterium]|nr:polyprenyl diphosphate synthase [Caulobacteraceae bacterium]
MQSELAPRPGLHVAIIMDGNGRWATRRGLPRSAGHRAGAETMRRIAKAAPDLGVTTLTLFAFSSYNWGRGAEEVGGLMRLLGDYLANETQTLLDSGARLTLIGRRDRLPQAHVKKLDRIERATRGGDRLHIRIAVDYSARESIEAAAARWQPGDPDLGRMIASSDADADDEAAEVDLLIRTGGDRRLSDFLLWEIAFAELWFTDQMWPDFDAADLARAIEDFRTRLRSGAFRGGAVAA